MPKKGYKQTEEHRKNLSKAHKGKKHPHTEKTKKKIKKSLKKYYILYPEANQGKNNGMYGKHHTEKACKKIASGHIKSGKYCKNKKYYCIDCSKKIWYDSKRCKSCAKKYSLNPAYINGKSKEPYPLEFNELLKEKIRKRDNYECKLCDIKQKNYYQKLTIHHIDYNKENLSWNNLITLCRGCNTKVNKDRNYYYAYFTYIMEEK